MSCSLRCPLLCPHHAPLPPSLLPAALPPPPLQVGVFYDDRTGMYRMFGTSVALGKGVGVASSTNGLDWDNWTYCSPLRPSLECAAIVSPPFNESTPLCGLGRVDAARGVTEVRRYLPSCF